MKKFHIDITEILQITVDIEAESEKKAIETVKRRYGNGEYNIGKIDLVAAEFDIRPTI